MKLAESHIGNIQNMLSLEGKTNTTPVLYKKTAKQFKKDTGIELHNAPLMFVKHNTFYELIHFTYKSRGRTFEEAKYSPFCGADAKFKRLERNDIKVFYDNFV